MRSACDAAVLVICFAILLVLNAVRYHSPRRINRRDRVRPSLLRGFALAALKVRLGLR